MGEEICNIVQAFKRVRLGKSLFVDDLERIILPGKPFF